MKPQPQPDWSQAVEHLCAADPKLAALIAQVGPCTMEIPHHFSIFYSLARSIVHQQLAGSAAGAILGRVDALFPRRHMTPGKLLELGDAALRGAGLSQNKLAALRDLAAKCLDGTVPGKRKLAGMADEEIIERISQVRGIGRWTVEMMLLFCLGRPNVLPVDDYGVRKGMQLLYKTRELPNKAAMRRRACKWEPWCSVASWYMWRCLERSVRAARAKPKPGGSARKTNATPAAAARVRSAVPRKKSATGSTPRRKAATKKAAGAAAMPGA
jgi:3-methyladenine DNA glycosylase/8-oxoguanine DNA glycosylase